jgi:hypothetical protein
MTQSQTGHCLNVRTPLEGKLKFPDFVKLSQ